MRDFVDENYLFGEIKIWSDSGVRKDSVGILVEAKSDEKLYRKFIVSKAIFFIVLRTLKRRLKALINTKSRAF
jgi:hypothetical protein